MSAESIIPENVQILNKKVRIEFSIRIKSKSQFFNLKQFKINHRYFK